MSSQVKQVTIQIVDNVTHLEVVSQLSTIIFAKKGDLLDVTIIIIPNSGFVYPDHLLLITSALNSAIDRGVVVSGRCRCHHRCRNYVSRMDFFQSLGISFEECFARQSSSGRFLAISKFQGFSQGNSYINEIVEILKGMQLATSGMLDIISFSLGELLGNITEHSLVDEGWMVAQYYPSKEVVRIMVADTGQGIHAALTTKPRDAKYTSYSPHQAIEECIIKGVTNGNGRGNGLYGVANFVKENGGILTICSGNCTLMYSNTEKRVLDSPFWQGTAVYLEINSNKPVKQELILDGHVGFAEDFDDWFGESQPVNQESNKNLDSLW
ncbi:hypothetical protein ACFQ4C_12155 [Larkinella insperata]|uniref:ATP-binding protein n=1 Tax=Larkinella insperata TaxID=332158 RepID=A0ABW3QAH6_9BACT|nr:ATP-binding protein [Larkinella insperata]